MRFDRYPRPPWLRLFWDSIRSNGGNPFRAYHRANRIFRNW